MLTSLNIRNIVLIDALTVEFSNGLNVLTGETGAGKSILLDSLGLVTGARADTGLIRKGEDQAAISAIIEADLSKTALEKLEDARIQIDGDLIVRRIITRAGKSRAFINDQPVGLALLQYVVRPLVEIHGQNDDAGLLAPSGLTNNGIELSSLVLPTTIVSAPLTATSVSRIALACRLTDQCAQAESACSWSLNCSNAQMSS